MIIEKAHCLFEQSGTFKKEFEKLGIPAFDYDILNNYGQTDYVVDLLAEIRGGYKGEPSIFDNISKDDLIIAFFPCTRFENQINLLFRGDNAGQKNWTLEQKMEYCVNLSKEREEFYQVFNYLFLVCYRKGLRLIVENPYAKEHFLTRYWCYEPRIIDKDRRDNGDYYAKPTQFWFLNCEPTYNFLLDPIEYNNVECKDAIRLMTKDSWGKTGAKTIKEARSMIHPTYANRFIRRYLLSGEKVE